MKLDVDMTPEELQYCLKGDFRDPTSIDRVVVGIPMFIFTVIGLHLNLTLWRIISVHKITLYNTLTIALDRFMMFITPWVGHSTYLGCHKRFNPYQLRFQYGCSDCPFYFDLLGYFATYMPVAIFTINITSDVIFASLLMLCASCLNTYTNPIVMFVFQERIRKSFTAWSKRLWLFSSDLKSLVDTAPSVFIASQAPSGMRSTVVSTTLRR
ncbi:hypothetical protein PENTCL1PPCAC_8101, partial [Pristionchus entomophagus]